MGRLTGRFVLAALLVAGLAGVGHAAPILFDFDVGSSPTNAGWTSAGAAGGTAGPVSIAITPVGSVSIDGRERGTAGTPQGVDNNNIQVPIGVYGDMYRDFLFVNGSNATSEGMNIAATGLAPNTDYNVTVWSYDSGSHSPARSANWGQAGGSSATLSFEGDNGGDPPGPDPNTNLLTDYSATFRMTTDGSGGALIEGRSTPGFTVSHNVFLNGIGIDEATGPPSPPPPPLSEFKIDIDVGAPVTEPGWTSLRASGSGGAAAVDGTTFQIYTADGSRNRSGPNDLTRDFVFDDGSGQAVGVIISGLPAGTWDTSLWSWDDSYPTDIGPQFIGYTKHDSGGTSSGPERIATDSAAVHATDPAGSLLINSDGTSQYRVFLRENNTQDRSRLNAIELTRVAAPTLYQIDIDSTNGGTSIATQAGWTSLDASNGNGSRVFVDGALFEVFSADDDRNRQAPNDLAADFVYDNGSGQAVGLTIRDLAPGAYKAEVWAWDQAVPLGNQIVGITQFAAGPEIIFTTGFSPSATDPFMFTFDSTNLPDGFGIFTRESNSRDESRFNALRLTAISQAPDGGLDLKIDLNDRSARGAANTQAGFEEFFLYGGGTPQSTTQYYDGATVTIRGVGVNLDDRRRTQPVNGGAFDQQELLRDFIFAINPGAEDESMEILFEGLVPDLLHEITIWSFDDGSAPTRTPPNADSPAKSSR